MSSIDQHKYCRDIIKKYYRNDLDDLITALIKIRQCVSFAELTNFLEGWGVDVEGESILRIKNSDKFLWANMSQTYSDAMVRLTGSYKVIVDNESGTPLSRRMVYEADGRVFDHEHWEPATLDVPDDVYPANKGLWEFMDNNRLFCCSAG